MHTDHIITLPLAQRLQIMEALWDSLSSDASFAAAIPAWHEKVLAQRTQLLDAGLEPPQALGLKPSNAFANKPKN